MKLIAEHVWTYIDGSCPAPIIDGETSYQVHGRWFVKSFRRGHWDGTKRFREFHRKSGRYRFPTGFLQAVCAKLDAVDYPYVLEDTREIELPSPVLELTDKTSLSGKFEFQADVVEQALGHSRGVIQAPTGAGKSVIGAAIIKSYDRPTIWLTHRQVLLHQTHSVLERKLGERVGLVGDSVLDPRRITVAMVQSMHARRAEPAIKSLLEQAQVLIGDEIHHLQSESWFGVFSSSPAAYRFGLTATPCTDGLGKALVAMTGDVIVRVSLRDMIDAGVLVQPRIWIIRTGGPAVDSDAAYPTIYANGVVHNEERNRRIVEVVKTFIDENKPAITLVRRVNHGNLLADQFCKAGVRAEFIQGKTPDEERRRLLDALWSGQRHVVAQSEILGEGVDLPLLIGLINATGTRGGGSKETGAEHEVGRSTIQYIGRTLRSAPGKGYAEYVDFEDTCHRSLRAASRERVQALEEHGFTPWIDRWENRT